MSRFGLRSCADSLKLSQNDKSNSRTASIQKSSKIVPKPIQKKQNVSSVIIKKRSSDLYTMTDETTAKNIQFVSPISIVCSIPLLKISGVLEKINKPKNSTINELEKCSKTTANKIMCLYCDKHFSTHTIQKKHVSKTHTLLQDRRCSSRNSNIQTSHEANQQLIEASNETLKYFSRCIYCKNIKGHIAASEKDLLGLFFHLVEHHTDKYFACKLCVLRFQNQGKLLKHMQLLHKKSVDHESNKSKEEKYSHIKNKTICQLWNGPHLRKSLSSQSSISPAPQNIALSSGNRSSVIKNKMFSRDEPILSRLGVAQNRLPNNRKGLRLRREALLPDILLKSDQSSACGKIRSKPGKIVQAGEYSDVIFRIPTRTDTCTFDNDFYEKVVSNVRNNLLFHLDGSIVKDTSLHCAVPQVQQSFQHIQSTLVKSSIVTSCEIHAATNLSSSTAFPTLLTDEQYGGDITSTKLKRPITKHSWKWKWDSFKKFKLINEGGKIIKKVKQPMLCLRDLTKLDMWTQLTMRQKNDLQNTVLASVSENSTSYCKEEKERLNDQLNNILDARLLPHIILEQSEQTLIKLENEFDLGSICAEESININAHKYDERYFSFLNLLPSYVNQKPKKIIILSGEWARPRCYLCMGCGSNFEKLKSLEEHKMFRHAHVYSTHYEIVGRELISSNLLQHFFIPKRALNRYQNANTPFLQRNSDLSKSGIICENNRNELPEDESSDSIQSILNSPSTTYSSKNSIDDCDTDIKMTPHINSSPTHSMHSASTIVSTQISNSCKPFKEFHSYISCTKCNRKCNGVLDLYRHMLDCSGDQIWNLAKKRKYRYYCGSKKRRQCNKYSNFDLKKKNRKPFKSNTGLASITDPKYSKTKTLPRQRPSDAESIKKMLENLPPKRVCKKIFPCLNKTIKSRLLVKRKIFNSQVLKQRRSKSVNQLNSLPKFKNQISVSLSGVKTNIVNKAIQCNSRKKSSVEELRIKNKKNRATEESLFIPTDQKRNSTATSTTIELQTISDGRFLKNYEDPKNGESNNMNIEKHNNDGLKNDCLTKTGCDKKRSKKINDCIAMLTGKLEQKLKTESHSECKALNSIEKDKSIGLLHVNKTAKRKTCSRRIVKIDFTNRHYKEATHQNNPMFQQPKELYLEASNQNMLKSSSSENVDLTFNYETPIDICPEPASNTSYIPSLHNNTQTISQMSVLNNASTDQNGYYDMPNEKQETSLNNDLISVLPSFPRNTTFVSLEKPIRRQTICGIDDSCFSGIYDDIEPLDLSKKSSFQSQTANVGITVNSGNKVEIRRTEKNIPLNSLKKNQFYSNLDLLKIPQVKNPIGLNKFDEKLFSAKNASRQKKNNKPLLDAISKSSVPTTCNNNVKELFLSKKDSNNKNKNTLKMDEVVINHIDDAINSVINAQKEQAICGDEKESEKPSENECNNGLKKIDECVNYDISFEKKTEEKAEENFTNLMRSFRSKTMDCTLNNITGVFHASIKSVEDKLSPFNAVYSQDIKSSQEDNNSKKKSKHLDNYKDSIDIPKFDSVKSSHINKEVNTLQTQCDHQITKQANEISNPYAASFVKSNELVNVDNSTAASTPSINQSKSGDRLGNIESKEVSNPSKKQRRRRKNELAAIVADQLLESFKIDKARRENLKRLENLAYEKSEDLLLTGMLLMSSTKRNASSSQFKTTNERLGEKLVDIKKSRKQDQCNKYIEDKEKPFECIDFPLDKDPLSKSKKKFVRAERGLKQCHTKQLRRRETTGGNNINAMKRSLESFSTKNTEEYETKSKAEINPSTPIISKSSIILRPSILSVTLESSIISKTKGTDGKSIVSSRDPRLNKNIHKEDNKIDNRHISKQRLSQSNNVDQEGNKKEDTYDSDEDNYLTEIAKNVNQKIMAENEDFICANDEFEIMSTVQEDSINKFYRPSTSMSVRSAPNLNEDRSNFDSMDEITNTEMIDMDLDDNLSIYTSFSQDVSRGRRRKRRRSILFSRKPKKKCNSDVIEIFECDLCKKTFYAASSLSKHQQTLAHVSKVSEQEYLLSKCNNKTIAVPNISNFEKPQKDDNVSPSLKKDIIKAKSATHDVKVIPFEPSNDRCNFNSISRLTLNPDERLFFECCTILKGSQTSRTDDIISSENCVKYATYEHQNKNETQSKANKKLNNMIHVPPNLQTIDEKHKDEIYAQSMLRDQPIISSKSYKTEDIYVAMEQNNSITSHISAVTNTTSRFKTKAAMKGYENITSSVNTNNVFESKSRSACKLTALAEIALGNENTTSHDSAIEQGVCCNFVQLNASKCVNITLNENPENIYETKSCQKNNDSKSITSSKTIMHLSQTAAFGQEADKIIIPERPFKNIGLEEKEAIQFQKPKATVNLLNAGENSVSTLSYSDRDDFDFASISCDDDNSVKNSITKVDKNTCSNSSSRATTKTFENKSLIMGRIFKNVNAKKNTNYLKSKTNTIQKEPIPPRADLNQIFDELRGNTVSKGIDSNNRNIFNDVLPHIGTDDLNKNASNVGRTPTRKIRSSKAKINDKRGRNFTKLQSELGIGPEELTKLIHEGQRKSKRRCATNRTKKLVEMWSSDEYEEFLSTKDIFALIEEKEKEEKKRKKKNSTSALNNTEDKECSVIESSKLCVLKKNSKPNEGSSKRSLLRRKISQDKDVKAHQTLELRKKKTANISIVTKTSQADDRSAFLENLKKKSKVNKLNADGLKTIKKEISSNTIVKSSKNSREMKKSHISASFPRRKRVASEKLYYWSSSSDEDFGKIKTVNDQNFESGEQYQKHGWIVGDSHKKLVTLLAIAKGNKKVDKCGVKKETSKKGFK